MTFFNLDKTSLKILALLQENSRISYTEIGKQIGMSSSSVKDRVEKLEESGVITQYSVKIDNAKIGYPITAITMLSCQGAYTPKEEAIIKMLSEYHQVLEVFKITGRNDFVIKVSVRTMEESKMINDKLGKFGQTETSFIVSEYMNNSGINFSKKLNKSK